MTNAEIQSETEFKMFKYSKFENSTGEFKDSEGKPCDGN